jgi:hydroxymethylpyrimidine/phosphomethylpyrimidine kinase
VAPRIAQPTDRSFPLAETRTTPGLPVALSIAGSDSCGGAGFQADLKTFTVLDTYGAAVVTAVTAQNTNGVRASLILEPDLIVDQIDAVAGDLQVHVTKTGMLGTAANVRAVAKAIKTNNLFPLVVDPVMVTKTGGSLIDDDAVSVLAEELLPLAAIVTPNRLEAARLIGRKEPLATVKDAIDAAAAICRDFHVSACVITGFHQPNDEEGDAVDLFFDGHDAHEVVSAWRPTDNTHGAGSVFAAAIAASLAHGQALDAAVQTAKSVVSEAIRQAVNLGHGKGPVNVLAYLKVKK